MVRDVISELCRSPSQSIISSTVVTCVDDRYQEIQPMADGYENGKLAPHDRYRKRLPKERGKEPGEEETTTSSFIQKRERERER